MSIIGKRDHDHESLSSYYNYGSVGDLTGTLGGLAIASTQSSVPPNTLRADLARLDGQRTSPGSSEPLAEADVEKMLTDGGKHEDGSKLEKGDMAMLTELANMNPQQRAQVLQGYEQRYEIKRTLIDSGRSAGKGLGEAYSAYNQQERERAQVRDIVPDSQRRNAARG
jgi:hypothetical protein